MAELPAESRISCRIEGDDTVLRIPKLAGASRGCFGGSWSVAAAFGFLAVTFAAQGILSKNLGWTFAGFGCFLAAGWQLLALRGLPQNSQEIEIRVGPESLSRVMQTIRRDWARSAVADLCIEGNSKLIELRLHLKDGKDSVCLLSGIDREELEWIREQIRLKWKMDAD